MIRGDETAASEPPGEPGPSGRARGGRLRTRVARMWDGGRRSRLALLGGVLAVVIVASGVTAGVVSGLGSDEECAAAPESAKALGRDPGRATKALDPGEDGSRLGPLRQLLRPGSAPLCTDEGGTGVAGAALLAATTGRTAARQQEAAPVHTAPMARVTHAAVTLLGSDRTSPPRIPEGLRVPVARMLAAYIGNVQRNISGVLHAEENEPTVVPADDHRASRFSHPREYHLLFGSTASVTLNPLVREVAVDPQAFAILYDAERAYFAGYLERLSRSGLTTKKKGESRLLRATLDAALSADLTATLLRARTQHAEAGRIPSLAAYEKAVLRHSRGLYRAAPQLVTSRPPQGRYAQRKPSGSVGRGPRAVERLLDGRYMLFSTLEAWASAHRIPAPVTTEIRKEIREGYLHTSYYG